MVRDILILGLFPAAMVYAAVSDLLTMTISNRLSLLVVGGFLLVAVAVGMPIAEIGSHALAAALVLAVSFCLFACGWIGGGDAKLVAATSLWFGFSHLIEYLFIASLLGGGMALFLLSARHYPLPVALIGTRWIERLHAANTGIPYGIALAAAGLLVYPETMFMRALAG
ncbi:MAG TPA: prepilin peptidase [Xanthobacteraceae bacterium]|jgi:prepilin peptidase CpaA